MKVYAGENPFVYKNCDNSFQLLYSVAQIPYVRNKIKLILEKQNLSDSEKVEKIANLLRNSFKKKN